MQFRKKCRVSVLQLESCSKMVTVVIVVINIKINNITILFFSFETKYLHERCGALLQRYYEAKDHQKKQIQSGG